MYSKSFLSTQVVVLFGLYYDELREEVTIVFFKHNMKPFFMTINTLLLISIAYLGVQMFYKQIDINFDKKSTIPAIKKKQSDTTQIPVKKRFKDNYKKIESRNLFNVDTGEKKEAILSDTIASKENLSLKPTELNLTLWGTVIGTISTYAVIEDKQLKIQTLYKVGDVIQNATIKNIQRDYVILRYNNQDYILESNLLQTPEKQVNITKAKSTNIQTIQVKESTIASSLANMNSLRRQINIKPVLKDGKPEGLLVYRIRSDSFFYNLGLRSGDVIKQVNDRPITSTQDAVTIYQNLKDTASIKVALSRKGEKQELIYQITPDKDSTK